MESRILESISGIVAFASYFGFSVLLLVLFCVVYARITPYPEYRLIKEGKIAPALSFGGAVLGFVFPLWSAVTHSVSFVDMAVWAFIAFLVQIIVFLVLRISYSNLIKDIAEDKISAGLLLGLLSLSVGILNAASMTY